MKPSAGSRAFAGLQRRWLDGLRRWPPPSLSARCAACQALVLNTGSSSIKYGVYDVVGHGDARLACKGLIEGVGLPSGNGMHKHHVEGSPEQKHQVDVADHAAGLQRVFDLLPQETLDGIKVVGHRVVNGGSRFSAPAVIDDEVEGAIQAALPLAPLHNPANLSGIQAARAVWSRIPHVAVFDTSFHATMPPEAYRYAVPKEWYEKYGIRRYGFHGTSYSYILGRVALELDRPPSSLNLIVCHIGSGASMACIKDGKSIDTTMGFTPLDGLVMGTRSGDVDGGVFSHLCNTAGMSVKDVDTALNKKSGLYGLSGFSDMRSLQESADGGNEDAALAERIYVERVRKYLGAYLVKLRNHVDAIVFTAGVGENSARFRTLACSGLEEFGIKVDPGKNLAVRGVAQIQDAFSKTKVMVVPTDEEGSIAIQSIDLVGVLPEPELDDVRSKRDGRFKRPKHDLMIVGESKESGTIAEELGLGSLLFPSVTASQGNCGYFRVFSEGPEDGHINLMREHFHLQGTYEEMHGMTLRDAVALGAQTGSYMEVLSRIIQKFKAYKKGKDLVLVGGNFATESGRQLCSEFAAAMQMPTLLLQDAHPPVAGADCLLAHTVATQEDVNQVHVSLRQNWQDMRVKGAPLAGVLVSNVPAPLAEGLRQALVSDGLKPWALTPPNASLESHTAAELAKRLDATILCGGEAASRVEIHNCRVITAHVKDFLQRIEGIPRTLVVVDALRTDVLFALMFAAGSVGGPDIAGILLTGTTELDPHTMQVIAGTRAPFPVLLHHKNTFATMLDISGLRKDIAVESTTKISSAIHAMEEHVDQEMLDSIFVEEGQGPPVEGFKPPKIFMSSLIQEAKALQRHIVLPEGGNARMVVAASELVKRMVCRVTLLGDPESVRKLAKAENTDLTGVNIVDPLMSDLTDRLAESMARIRERNGQSPSVSGARQKLQNELYFGTMMVAEGLCDGMVLGATYSTDRALRPAIDLLPRQLASETLSSVYFMLLPDGVKIIGDCSINLYPDAQQLADITALSVDIALQFGVEPRVALLEPGQGSSMHAIAEQEMWLDQAAEGAAGLASQLAGRPIPLLSCTRLEVAVDPVAARQATLSAEQTAQDPEGRVPGRASVLVFPDLKSSQEAFQLTMQASRCAVLGPVMLGFERPVNYVFGGCTVEDIVSTVAVTCVQTK